MFTEIFLQYQLDAWCIEGSQLNESFQSPKKDFLKHFLDP